MILTSKVSIISAALVHLGENPIAADSDDSRGNRAAQAVYDIIRRSKLASHPWRFALKQQTLTPIADETDPESTEFENMYQRPADALLIWGLTSQRKFRTYATQIGANDDDPKLIYIADVDAPSLFAPFVEALMYEIAAACAVTVTQSVNKAQYYKGLAKEAWRGARLKDSQQGWPVEIPLDIILNSWPTPRGG